VLNAENNEACVMHVIKVNQLQQQAARVKKSCKPPYIQTCAKCGRPYEPSPSHPSAQQPFCECSFCGDPYGSIEVDYHYDRQPLDLKQKRLIRRECVINNGLCEQESPEFQAYSAELRRQIAEWNIAHPNHYIIPLDD